MTVKAVKNPDCTRPVVGYSCVVRGRPLESCCPSCQAVLSLHNLRLYGDLVAEAVLKASK